LNGSASVDVINIDGQNLVDQVTGERIFRVDIAAQVSMSKTTPSTMNPFSQPNMPRWRFYLSIYFPFSEWKNQYQVGQKYELTIRETGELILKPSEKI
jgi:hypothetical protein